MSGSFDSLGRGGGGIYGSDEIHLDETELALAEWHERNALPSHDDGISLTREMIRVFGEGREPR